MHNSIQICLMSTISIILITSTLYTLCKKNKYDKQNKKGVKKDNKPFKELTYLDRNLIFAIEYLTAHKKEFEQGHRRKALAENTLILLLICIDSEYQKRFGHTAFENHWIKKPMSERGWLPDYKGLRDYIANAPTLTLIDEPHDKIRIELINVPPSIIETKSTHYTVTKNIIDDLMQSDIHFYSYFDVLDQAIGQFNTLNPK